MTKDTQCSSQVSFVGKSLQLLLIHTNSPWPLWRWKRGCRCSKIKRSVGSVQNWRGESIVSRHFGGDACYIASQPDAFFLCFSLASLANESGSFSNAFGMVLPWANPTEWVLHFFGFLIKQILATITRTFSAEANVTFWTKLTFFPHSIARNTHGVRIDFPSSASRLEFKNPVNFLSS